MRKILVSLLGGGVLLMLLGTTLALVAAQSETLTPLPERVSGIVLSGRGNPINGALVQIQGQPDIVETNADGVFTLEALGGTEVVTIVAWAPYHYNGWVTLDPANPDWGDGQNLLIELVAQPRSDHSGYDWFSFDGVEGSAACGICHREYSEWRQDQHSQSAINHRFLNMYTGQNIDGETGQPMQWGTGGAALPPDPSQPYTGPGFLPDNPGGQVGNCASCHTPAASKISNQQNCAWSGCHSSLTVERASLFIDTPPMPLALTGDAAEGISCEFCHKIANVIVDPETNMPYPASPGILSLELVRPREDGQQIFFGTLVDVAREDDSYHPLISESVFCSACHVGVFGGVVGDHTVASGTVVYNSYGEWLDSSYSDPATGQTCQDCHMPPSDANWFVTAEQGGLERDYVTLHDHTMLGITDAAFMQQAATMTTDAEIIDGELRVTVSIHNDNTGHHLPTDSPLRSVMLVVEATDQSGQPLPLRTGDTNPAFTGNYAGTPGRTFAKILRDEWTGEAPTASFWRPITLVEDTRIPALATDVSQYTFTAPTDGPVIINTRLIFRRAFQAVSEQKGWDDPDIIMQHNTLELEAN